jgi:hypothetical protein
MPSYFIIKNPAPEKQIIILIYSDDRLQLLNHVVIGMVWIDFEVEAACFVQFQFKCWIEYLQVFQGAVI